MVKVAQNQSMTAVGWSAIAATLFSAQDALVKWLATDLPLLQLMFARSLVAVPILFVILLMHSRRHPRTFHTARPFAHGLRAATNISAFLCHYYAVTRMPLADAVAIAMSAPLFVTVLSGLLLGELADTRRKAALTVGLIGVVVVVQPTGNVDWVGVGSALLGSFLFALLAIQNRYLSATESTGLMVFSGALGFLVVTGLCMPFVWVTPSAQSLGLMLVLGVITLTAQFSITHAYRFAPVYVVAPAEYLVVVWAVFYGWMLFAQLPSPIMVLGTGIIIASGVYIVRLEQTSDSRP